MFLFSAPKATVPGAEDDMARYIQTTNAHRGIDRRLRATLLLLVVAVLLIPVTLLAPHDVFGFGASTSAANIVSGTGGRVQAIGEMFSGSAAGRAMEIYFWQALAVALAGAALALSGAVFQGALKNALAAPSTLGVTAGGTLGTVIYTLLFMLPATETGVTIMKASEMAAYFENLDPLEYIITTQQRAFCSLVGCLIVVALVLIVAYVAGRGRVSKVGLIISGQVFAAIIAGVVEMVRFYIRDHGTEAQLSAMRNIVGGSFSSITGPMDVAIIVVPVVLGIAIIMLLRTRLNLLAFDEEEARSMGLSTNRTRNAVVIVCTVLTAVIISFCGAVGFVGFLVPHLARKIVGPDFRYYIPASICLGAAYLLIANAIMQMFTLFAGSIGTFTSIIGVIAFAYLAIKNRAKGNVDWV